VSTVATIESRQDRQTVFVDTFTDGLLGPDVPMLGPVADGGHIVVNPTTG
jgi:formamidase